MKFLVSPPPPNREGPLDQEGFSPAPPAGLALFAVEAGFPAMALAGRWPLSAEWMPIPKSSLAVWPSFLACLGDGCRKIGIPLNPPVNRLSANSQRQSNINVGVSLADQSKNQTGANVESHGVNLPEIV
jgi:hypothetical protein